MSSGANITPDIQRKFEELKEKTIHLFSTLCEPRGDSMFDSFRKEIKKINIVSRKGGKMTRKKRRQIK